MGTTTRFGRRGGRTLRLPALTCDSSLVAATRITSRRRTKRSSLGRRTAHASAPTRIGLRWRAAALNTGRSFTAASSNGPSQTATTYTFFGENDTFIVPRKLMKTGFENYDLSGKLMFIYPNRPHVYYVEPGGYFISQKAARAVLATTPNHLHFENLVCDVVSERETRSLSGFWDESMWHYRAQGIMDPVIGDGYPQGSRWMFEMYEKHGGQ